MGGMGSVGCKHGSTMKILVPLLFAVLVAYTYGVPPGDTEKAAGKAISKLLKEKISAKFKEAADEVKGVLTEQLGSSLKQAHDRMKPKKKKKVAKALTGPGAPGKGSSTPSTSKGQPNGTPNAPNKQSFQW